MRKYAPKVIRYCIGSVGILWSSLGALGVILLAVGLFVKLALDRSPPTLQTVIEAGNWIFTVITPTQFLISLSIVFGIGTILGRKRYGTLLQFTQASLHRVDGVLGYSLFEDPEVEGRVFHNEVAWRCQYWEDGHIDVLRRECPFCGLELVELYLPRYIVFEPNTAFAPGEESRETATEAWHDVFGEETAEDRDEVSALACPQCNFSIPGEKSVLEGNDGARAKFEQHVQIMKTGNSHGSPFKEYSEAVSERADGNPPPVSIWNEYVAKSSADDVLTIGVDSKPERNTQEPPKQASHQNAS